MHCFEVGPLHNYDVNFSNGGKLGYWTTNSPFSVKLDAVSYNSTPGNSFTIEELNEME